MKTKLPVYLSLKAIGAGELEITNESGNVLAVLNIIRWKGDGSEMMDFAMHLVSSANSHESLLSAAKGARELLNDHASFSDNDAEAEAVQKLDAAIAAAEA